MSRPRTSKRAALLTRILDQRRWIDEHGGTLAAYVERYGSASEPTHYGAGGEAIYAADAAELDRLEAEYNRGAR